MGKRLTIIFTCPADGDSLILNGQIYHCSKCESNYPVINGVLCTLKVPDLFYEGAYRNRTSFLPKFNNLMFNWPLWVINSGWLWVIKNHVPRGGVLLELGCAGGVDFLGDSYQAIGCDLSFSSLQNISCYKYKVQMDASKCINLKSESVDAIVSSYFWEHIDPSAKPAILAECFRVLKPNGKIIFLYDVVTKNPLISWFRSKNPLMYSAQFIDGDGHVGYETIGDNIYKFEAAGFKVIKNSGLERTPIQSPSIYQKLQYFSIDSNKSIFRYLTIFGKSPYFYPYSLLIRIVDAFIGPLLPLSWSRIHLLVAQKTLHR